MLHFFVYLHACLFCLQVCGCFTMHNRNSGKPTSLWWQPSQCSMLQEEHMHHQLPTHLWTHQCVPWMLLLKFTCYSRNHLHLLCYASPYTVLAKHISASICTVDMIGNIKWPMSPSLPVILARVLAAFTHIGRSVLQYPCALYTKPFCLYMTFVTRK